MNPVILMRLLSHENEELVEARKHLKTVEQRTLISPDDLVIGRYSVLPYYKELEQDLPEGARLINSFIQHSYVANLSNWYEDLKELTPETWFSLQDFKQNNTPTGPKILKGLTNSRKFLWSTHMYAHTAADVDKVYCRLMDDTMISEQGICIRQFVPFKNYGKDIHGMPITKEFRVFVLNKNILTKSFYWSNHSDSIEPKPNPDEIPTDFLNQVIDIIGDKCNFYTIDVAQDINDKWCNSDFSGRERNIQKLWDKFVHRKTEETVDVWV